MYVYILLASIVAMALHVICWTCYNRDRMEPDSWSILMIFFVEIWPFGISFLWCILLLMYTEKQFSSMENCLRHWWKLYPIGENCIPLAKTVFPLAKTVSYGWKLYPCTLICSYKNLRISSPSYRKIEGIESQI